MAKKTRPEQPEAVAQRSGQIPRPLVPRYNRPRKGLSEADRMQARLEELERERIRRLELEDMLDARAASEIVRRDREAAAAKKKKGKAPAWKATK